MTTATTSAAGGGKPLIEGEPTPVMQFAVRMFVIVPFVALVSAVLLLAVRGRGPSWLDVGLTVGMYCVTCAGIGVGFHRCMTHRAFKAKRPLKIALAIAGSCAVQGNIIQWVADHRRHHEFTDQEENDPHSPWRYGGGWWGLTRGLFHAHVGWLFHRQLSNRAKFAPDLLKDNDIRIIDRLFLVFVVLSLGGPALIGGLVTGSWWGALSAFFWAGVVRVGLLHHVTWSVNSVCHVFGKRPFETQEHDRASNVWCGSPCYRSARRGTTSITPFRSTLATASTSGRWTSTPGSFGSSSCVAWQPTCVGRSLRCWHVSAAKNWHHSSPSRATVSRCVGGDDKSLPRIEQK